MRFQICGICEICGSSFRSGLIAKRKERAMSEEMQERIRQAEQSERFWKRCALVALGVLMLVLVAFTSLSVALYAALMTEKDRFAQQMHEIRSTAEEGLQRGKELLRGLKLDRRKVEQRLKQFLAGETPKEPAPAP
jgi:hypothetical protein